MSFGLIYRTRKSDQIRHISLLASLFHGEFGCLKAARCHYFAQALPGDETLPAIADQLGKGCLPVPFGIFADEPN